MGTVTVTLEDAVGDTVGIWQPGHRIGGGRDRSQYTIERLLGEGGFCCTYQARDRQGQIVAIKTLNAECSQSSRRQQWQQSLANEALRLAQCHHPHVVRVEEFVLDGLRWCVVLEYVPGPSLDALVEQQGALPLPRAIALLQQLGTAIAHLHAQGWLHRDIKPLNVLTRANGDAVLIDFGLACPFAQDVPAVQPDYATRGFAPLEQYDRYAKRGAYCDVYGLAATAYFLITGEIPRSPLTRSKHLRRGDPDPLVPPVQYCPELGHTEVGDRLNSALLHGLALQPEDRPPTVAHWFAELGLTLLSANQPAIATPSPTFPAATPDPRDPAADDASDPYASAVGMPFGELRSLLETGQWQAADRETDRMMQAIAGVKSGAAIAVADLDNLPSRDLRTLTQLWDYHSQGRFGFRAQLRLWQECNPDHAAFAEQVGWTQQGRWLPYGDLQFHARAPVGHLPTWGRRGKLWAALGDRLLACL